MDVQIAQREDFSAWLALAAEVEHLFGPMVSEAGFHEALSRNIERGSAFCIRADYGPPGAPLWAGLLWSAKPPAYQIGWLSVASRSRRRGLGRALVEHVIGLVAPPAEVKVETFGPEAPDGEPARRFYEAMGFAAAEMSGLGPDGRPHQVFRRLFPVRKEN